MYAPVTPRYHPPPDQNGDSPKPSDWICITLPYKSTIGQKGRDRTARMLCAVYAIAHATVQELSRRTMDA